MQLFETSHTELCIASNLLEGGEKNTEIGKLPDVFFAQAHLFASHHIFSFSLALLLRCTMVIKKISQLPELRYGCTANLKNWRYCILLRTKLSETV